MISFVSFSFLYCCASLLSRVFLAIVTHKGAAADAGHYIGFVKKSVFHSAKPASDGSTPLGRIVDDEDEDWYKFDDDKVSIFPKEKLPTLEGGGGFSVCFCCGCDVDHFYFGRGTGEDSSAYVLVYKSKSF